MDGYLPIILMLLVVGASCALLLVIGRRLAGPVDADRSEESYESGEDPLGRARVRLNVPFYRIGILFLLFEVVAIFLFLWAVVYARLLDQGSGALLSMLIFLGMLLVAYAYAIRKGVLEWE